MPSNPLTKFGPLIVLAVIQLVLVLAAPSTAPKAQTAAALGGGYGATTGAAGATVGAAGAVAPGAVGAGGTTAGTVGAGAAAGGTSAAGGGAAGAGGAGGSGPASTTGGQTGGGVTTASGSALANLPGDKTHCSSGRQFSPSIDYYAPPCVPGKPGAPYADNGGATYPGVSATRIEVVNYVADYGAEVDAILKAQGLYYNASAAKTWNAAYANFINSHYQLWGRSIHIDTVQGNCTTVPPDVKCLIGDMDRLVSTYHPYAVYWGTTVCSQCFAELSRLHVVNFGGSGFSDAFHNANAPYSYDAGESATQTQLQFADWWCHQMAGRNAVFAGKENPAQNFRNTKRQLGVISTNDPDNETTVHNVLYPALKKCGVSVNGHEYFYAQDINTATQQSQTTVAKMNTPSNPATSVVCLCDAVAPQFLYNGSADDNYWPENIIADEQGMDFDTSGQTYEASGSPSLACPNPSRGCPYDNTVGLSTDDPQVAPDKTPGVITFKLGGGKALPSGTSAASVSAIWTSYGMLASLIQNSGPVLTPTRMQAAAPQLGARGGGTTGHPLRAFSQGSWCWTKDARVVYWDKKKASPYNGKPGTYVDIESSRFTLGHYPTMSQPPAPAPEARS